MEEIEYTNRLKMPLLIPNQSGKEIFHNEAIITIDNILQNCVLDKDLTTPPENPAVGDMYIVGVNGSGDWLNKDNNIAFYDNGWRFLEQKDGFLFFVKDEGCFYNFVNNIWQKIEKTIDLSELKNINFVNLNSNDIIVYDGENFINKKDVILNSVNLNNNNKIEITNNNLGLFYNNNETWTETLTLNNSTGRVDFKNGISFNGVNFEELTGNNITGDDLNTKINTNLDNISDLGKENLQNLNSLDWDRIIDITSSTPYTFEEDGYLELYTGGSYIGYKSSLDTTTKSYTYILAASGGLQNSIFYRVQKGETITRLAVAGSSNAYFIPLKINN